MPFGLTNAPATFQRMMNTLLGDLSGTAAYLDDVVVVADNWDEHLVRLRRLFQRLQDTGLTIQLKKSVFGRGTVNYLGHIVGKGCVKPKEANIEAILRFPLPQNRKDVMRFLGMVGYYRRFCNNFATIAAPLTNLTRTSQPFQWTASCEESFHKLKFFLTSEPVLRTPDFDLPFHLQVDASGVGIGAVLLQPAPPHTVLHPVAYFSMKLKPHQCKYSTIEKEALALVTAVKKFECYLQLAPHKIRVFTDHNPLTFIRKMRNSNQRILRWALALQPYQLDIHHIKGADNILADALSRHPSI